MTALPFLPVILAGGSGERFWPLSRKHRPKQFLTLDETGRSLLQATSDRLSVLSGSAEQVMVVTGGEYRTQVLEQLPEMPVENLIVEPVARDTAPAVLYAALRVAQEAPDAVMGVFPADHRITDPGAFGQVVRRAISVAHTTGQLVTLGITPTFAATGYGYIQRGELLLDGELPAYRVDRFTEKPDAQTARTLVADGRYTWNSGMFIWRVEAILAAFRQHQPEMYAQLSEAFRQGRRAQGIRTTFPELRKISIDYAILEKSDQVVVIPAEFGWDDLGDWNALERLLKTEGQNVTVGRHVGLDTGGAILYTTRGDDLIATIGLEDVVIVRTDEVTLVVRKDRTQDIKKVVQQLKAHPELERFA
ncbi:mannose-1-phosphate guanylyltransferase [Deinococcus metallilatus]|uniref:Mannose-1-phosphate guanylyltransferase n=1 Tax=Deinococcus metallilatus TaxID=1211322 RepID=A0ABR6MYM7_9DEIO|nr:mannose-1-phosphate guanylyltransferase [Deinococcus metallilatus]MBB5297044.1 mannose-1-phosphate guanylyltransferase [Deinococcus metallilatus]GMA16010.1 mannose-1-phosphate guanylyltransferase [Deinococcus metallilatus]